jgi:hypothetical protein
MQPRAQLVEPPRCRDIAQARLGRFGPLGRSPAYDLSLGSEVANLMGRFASDRGRGWSGAWIRRRSAEVIPPPIIKRPRRFTCWGHRVSKCDRLPFWIAEAIIVPNDVLSGVAFGRTPALVNNDGRSRRPPIVRMDDNGRGRRIGIRGMNTPAKVPSTSNRGRGARGGDR